MHFLQFMLGMGTLSISVNFVVSLDTRIVGGSEAADGQFPYQVYLLFDNSTHRGFFCGGSIIHERYVLTAAHCVHGGDPRYLFIVAGTNSLTIGGVRYSIEELIVHPLYIPTLPILVIAANDIALMKTAIPIVMGGKVQIISLPEEDTKPGTELTVSGWGRTKHPPTATESYIPDKLQYITVTTIGIGKCFLEYMFPLPAFVFTNNICASTRANQGFCSGDSGGPLAHKGDVRHATKNVQVGVVSWTALCAVGKPDIYTNVLSFVPWIKKQMK